MIKLKRHYLFLFLVIILLSVIVAQIVITGSSIKAIQGATDVSYPISLDNNESVVGFQIEVNYSTDFLIFKSAEATSRMPSATIITNDVYPILKIAVLVNNESDKITPGDGAVLNLIFDVNESAIPNDYEINLSKIVIINIETTVLLAEINNGTFTIVEPYNFTFLPPVSLFENFSLQDGATLPLKFSVENATSFVLDDSVEVRIFNSSLGIDKTYNASGEGDGFIIINGTEEQYIVNIHTGQLEMPLGNYDIVVSFDNFQEEFIGFELILNGKGKGRQK